MEVLARKHTYTYTHTSKNWDTHKHKKQKRFRALVSPVHSQDHVSVLFLYFLLWFTHNHNLLQGFSCLWKSGSTSTSLTTASCHCLHWTTICLSAVNVTVYNGSRGQGSMEACEDGGSWILQGSWGHILHTHTLCSGFLLLLYSAVRLENQDLLYRRWGLWKKNHIL